MNSTDIVGWANTEDGYCLCIGCYGGQTPYIQRKCEPIFANSEWDEAPVCDRCSEIIEDVCVIPKS